MKKALEKSEKSFDALGEKNESIPVSRAVKLE